MRLRQSAPLAYNARHNGTLKDERSMSGLRGFDGMTAGGGGVGCSQAVGVSGAHAEMVMMRRGDWDSLRAELAEARERLEAALKTAASLHVQRDELQAEVSKLTARRDRWRQRAEDAERHRYELRRAFDDAQYEAGSQLSEAIAERDEARACAAKDVHAALRERDDAISALNAQVESAEAAFRRASELRAELAQARSKALTEAADSLEREALAGTFGRGILYAVARVRSMIDKPSAKPVRIDAETTNADRVRAGHPAWQGRPIIEVPDPTPGVEPEPGTADWFDARYKAVPETLGEATARATAACAETLRAILAAVDGLRTSADGIRADLQRARDARRV